MNGGGQMPRGWSGRFFIFGTHCYAHWTNADKSRMGGEKGMRASDRTGWPWGVRRPHPLLWYVRVLDANQETTDRLKCSVSVRRVGSSEAVPFDVFSGLSRRPLSQPCKS